MLVGVLLSDALWLEKKRDWEGVAQVVQGSGAGRWCGLKGAGRGLWLRKWRIGSGNGYGDGEGSSCWYWGGQRP